MDETKWGGLSDENQDQNVRELPRGSTILQGRYHFVQLLHQRPRVNLYLAQRLLEETSPQQENVEAQSPYPFGNTASPLAFSSSERKEVFIAPPVVPVVIRELVLSGLSFQERKQIERAAFEEFVSPAMLGSPRLPGAGDRIRIEGERHYLVMQLRRTRGTRQALAVTLAELLLQQRDWPEWLTLEVALDWGIQLCRLVARLHRLGVILGDLDLNTILVDSEGPSEWAPVLLIYWPPAPLFWQDVGAGLVPDRNTPIAERYARIFPLAQVSVDSAFAAPEMLHGRCNEGSDVYSLGALLYLLLTRYAPTAAALRSSAAHSTQALELAPLHLFNSHIPVALEKIVLRALSLDPLERYPSVFALVEALEAVSLEQMQNGTVSMKHGTRRLSKMGQMMEWLRQELDT